MRNFWALLLALTLLGSSAAFAGGHGECTSCKSAEELSKYIDKKVDKLSKTLNLKDSQKSSVRAIISDKMDKKHDAKKEYKARMSEIGDEFRTKMSGVLEGDQQTKFDKMMAKYEEKNKGCKKCKKKKRFLLF